MAGGGGSRSQPSLSLGIVFSRCLPAVPRGSVGIAPGVLDETSPRLTRPLSPELQRRDSPEAEAFLEAVRFYRQERGRYGAGDLLLGPEPEVGKALGGWSVSSKAVAPRCFQPLLFGFQILGNVLMEDLLPLLRSQVLPSIRGSERRRQQLWLQVNARGGVGGSLAPESQGLCRRWQTRRPPARWEGERSIGYKFIE